MSITSCTGYNHSGFREIITVLISVPSFIFVFVMLGMEDHSILAYLAYLLSAYALIITVTGINDVVKAIRNGIAGLPLVKRLRNTSWGNRLLGDVVFRSEISLHGSLLINILYVGFNLFSGIRYSSLWFIALAFYYALLSVMRAVLVLYVHRRPVGEDITSEFKRYRACGIILLLMNQALAGIVVCMVTENRGFSYPGLMIYVMAMYAFYITIVAAVNVVKFRRRGSPLLSAAKVISLTAALASMLSLETAMLAQFGGENVVFRRLMLGISGGAVCTIVLTMAIYMIARSTRQLKRLQDNNLKTSC